MNSRQAGRSTAPRSHIANAVTELLAERDHLAARLAKVDAVIAGMREVFHLPATPARVHGKHTTVSPPANGSGIVNGERARISDALVRIALQNGPLSPEIGRAHSELQSRRDLVCRLLL